MKTTHRNSCCTLSIRKETNMFKIGDTVTVKNLTDAERAQYAFYNDIMKKYEGQKGQIQRITTSEYVVEFPDHRIW